MDILSLLFTIYACRKDLAKHMTMFYNSKIGKVILKGVVITGFGFLLIFYLVIFTLTLLKYQLTVNAFYMSSAIFVTLFSLTTGYFYVTFKDLFFTKN